MTYVVGVSSGIFGAASTEERMQGISVGLYKKAQFCITKGVEFVQIDLESISEFKEPNLKENMERLERMGITFGIHSEVAAFGGREFPHLDSAIDVDYERGHRRLIEVLKQTGELGAKFVLVHSSESTPFLLLGQTLQPTALVDIWGRPFSQFLEKYDEKQPREKKLSEWAIKQDFVREAFLHGYAKIDNLVEERVRALKRAREEQVRIWKEEIQRKGETITPKDEEEFKKFIEKAESDEEKERSKEKIFDDIRLNLIEFFRTRSLSYGPEKVAYFLIAKWMEDENCPIHNLWNNIINTSVKYYSVIESPDKKNPMTQEEWLEKNGIKKVNGRWSLDDPKFREEYKLWVPAVSAAYVWGHFNTEKCPNPEQKKKYEDPKEIIKKYKDKNKEFVFTLETPMASPGLEEYLRFPNPLQIYELCKEVGLDIMQLAIDIEHMLMSNQDPEITFELMPEDVGKYVRVVHAGWPSPLGPAHIPIQLGSEQHRYLYEMYYMLRQKGFGKDKSDYYLVFERGGGADPIQQSIIALKLITKFLELNTKPEDLPNEFYGIEAGQIASVERQWVAIEEHGRDPLKGLITVPEEEYTFLGRAALEKGKRPEEWKKEELR